LPILGLRGAEEKTISWTVGEVLGEKLKGIICSGRWSSKAAYAVSIKIIKWQIRLFDLPWLNVLRCAKLYIVKNIMINLIEKEDVWYVSLLP
jgi:hypothetical protein